MPPLTQIHWRASPKALALVASLILPLLAHAVQDCNIAGVPVNPANGNTTAGKTGLMRCVDRSTGAVQREQELRSGKFVGMERYFRNGKLEREFSVNERGNKDGRAREFAPSGQVVLEESYVNGDLVGIARRYAESSGRPVRVSFHEAGKGERAAAEFTPTGQLSELRCADKPVLGPDVDDALLCGHRGAHQVELFTARQALRARVTYLTGQRVRQELLHDSGKPERIIEMQEGARTEQWFSATGAKLREQRFTGTPTRSTLVLEQRYSERGSLLEDKRWDDKGLRTERRYYMNGQPELAVVEHLIDGVRQEERTRYHDNGQVASTGRFAPGSGYRTRAIGRHQHFDDKGRLREEVQFDDKGSPAREKAWDDKGVLTRDDEVFADGSRKAYSK